MIEVSQILTPDKLTRNFYRFHVHVGMSGKYVTLRLSLFAPQERETVRHAWRNRAPFFNDHDRWNAKLDRADVTIPDDVRKAAIAQLEFRIE